MTRTQPTRSIRSDPGQIVATGERQSRLLMDMVPLGIQECDTDGVITLSSPAHAEMHGYEDGELVGKCVWELLDDAAEQDELRAHLAWIVGEQPPPRPYFCKGRTKDGCTFDVRFDWAFRRDEEGNVTGLISVVTDITERMRAEKILRENEKRARLIIEVCPVALWVANTRGEVLDVNSAWTELTGYTREEALSKDFNWQELTAPDFRGRDLRAIEEIKQTGKHMPFEKEIIRKDGSKVPVFVGAMFLNEEEVGVGFLVDLTARIQAEEKLRESDERFRRAIEEAPIPIMIHADDGEVFQISKTWTELTGYSHEQIPTLNAWVKRAYGTHWTQVKGRIEELFDLDDRVDEGEYEISTSTGEKRTWTFSTAPLGTLPDGRRLVTSMAMDITERKKAERALKRAHDELEFRVEERTAELAKLNRTLSEEIEIRRKNEQELRLSAEITQNMAEGVCLLRASDGCLVFTNPRFDELFGYETGELIGRNTAILNAPGERTPEETACEILHDLDERGIWSGEVHNIRKDGTSIWTHSSVSTFEHPKHGTVRVAVVEDITERRVAEQALLQSEKRLRDILDSVFGFVGICTTDGILLEANRAPLEAVGLKKEDVIGQPFWDTYWWSYSSEVQDQLKEALRRAANGETVRYDVPVRVADDVLIEIDVTFGPLYDSAGNISQLLGFAVDISDRKRAEEELRQHQEKLAHISRLSTMGEMATGLAHEINQPLGAIVNYCFVGEQTLANAESIDLEQLRELFQDMSEQALRAGEIIRRLRSLVGKRAPVRSRVDVAGPIQEVLQLLASDLRQSEVRLEQKIEPSIPAVWIDEVQIQQVLVNLIRNALDAMSETERDLRSLTIIVSRSANDMVEVAVSDTGKGISSETGNQVFDAFFSAKAEGMGMGLTISRTILESHGGRLWLTPNEDRGVTFRFTLPIARKDIGDVSEQAGALGAGG